MDSSLLCPIIDKMDILFYVLKLVYLKVYFIITTLKIFPSFCSLLLRQYVPRYSLKKSLSLILLLFLFILLASNQDSRCVLHPVCPESIHLLTFSLQASRASLITAHPDFYKYLPMNFPAFRLLIN